MARKKRRFRRLRHSLTVPLVKALILSCRVTPRPFLRVQARILGSLLAFLPLKGGRVIRLHREKVMDRLGIKASTRAIYASVIQGYFDFFHLNGKGDASFCRAVRVQGEENLHAALGAGRGVIAVTAHFSAWELIPRAVRLLGVETGVVGRELTHRKASRVLEDLRASHGIHVLSRDGGVGPIVRLLRSNAAIGILIDQYTSRVRSETVDFLGIPARTPSAPATLSRKLNVPVVPMHIERLRDNSYLITIEEPLEYSPDILDILNGRIGGWILSAPEQWVWFHERWKGTGLREKAPNR